MILSRAAIDAAVQSGEILIDPFDAARVNSASYTFSIADELFEVVWTQIEDRFLFDWRRVELVDGSWLLEPKKLYLATTTERIGSDAFAVRLTGRPALGYPGLFVQVTADLGHQGAKHRWTLELIAAVPTRVFPHRPIGQASFWKTSGKPSLYRGAFGFSDAPMRSTLHMGYKK